MDTPELIVNYNELRLASFVMFICIVSIVAYDITISTIHKTIYCLVVLSIFMAAISYLNKQEAKNGRRKT